MKNAPTNAASNVKSEAAAISRPLPRPADAHAALVVQREGRPMPDFNYDAAAELFPTRRRLPRRQPLGYKRFAQAAQAIRFAMEDLAPDLLIGACLEVDEQRYGSDDIRRLYESAKYPLTRRGARS
jgi:hypothetical protein